MLMGDTQKLLLLLEHSTDPSLRSYLVNRLGPLGVEPAFLVAKLDQESDVSIRRALILALGEYPEGRFSIAERDSWTEKLINLYRYDRDPGIHGAAEWLLRKWGNEDRIKKIEDEVGKLSRPVFGQTEGAGSSNRNDREWYVNSEGQTMVIVRDPFASNTGEPLSEHRERIRHHFAIAAKEVTVKQFQRFLNENPRLRVTNDERFSPEESCPMNSVSWYDAAAYCNWLSKQDGIAEDQWCYGPNEKGDYADGMKLVSNGEKKTGYRLPNEMEWEYSCRAGTGTPYSFGETPGLLEKYGWYFKNSPGSRTQPVGSLKPNDLGLFDLHGNLWEWCQGRWDGKTERDETSIDQSTEGAMCVAQKDRRLFRGGAYNCHPWIVRSVIRDGDFPSCQSISLGFRPARTYD
jgi:formylglycine-generating enzyme required for sulfatase activity